MISRFLQKKKDVLNKQDKSSKGDWDEKIVSLCEKINSFDCCYTTSSCAGRVVLMVDQVKKENDLFLKVWHDEIGFGDLKEELDSQSHQPSPQPTRNPARLSETNCPSQSCSPTLSLSRLQAHSGFNGVGNSKSEVNHLIKFKMEQCILHVACCDLESAQSLLGKARQVGWKRSGIISGKDGFVVELNSTEKLEFPVIADGKILVGDDFLKLVVEQANEKLRRGWLKIQGLLDILEFQPTSSKR